MRFEFGKALFIKNGKNQIQKNSKHSKKDVSEITCDKSWVKGNYGKDRKDLKQLKPSKKNKKKCFEKNSKIKTNLTAVVTVVSTPACESKPVTIVNDEGAWSALADDDCVACMIVKLRWSINSAFTIHLTPYCESFNKYQGIPIAQRRVAIVNE